MYSPPSFTSFFQPCKPAPSLNLPAGQIFHAWSSLSAEAKRGNGSSHNLLIFIYLHCGSINMSKYMKFDFRAIRKYAQELRNNMTEYEKLLWNELRGKKLSGFKYLRQHFNKYTNNQTYTQSNSPLFASAERGAGGVSTCDQKKAERACTERSEVGAGGRAP